MSVFQDISNTWKCLVYGSVLFLRCPDRKKGYKAPPTWSGVQKMWASSCWNRRTRVRPVRAPDTSLRWRTPKSAILRGNSLHDLLLVLLFVVVYSVICLHYCCLHDCWLFSWSHCCLSTCLQFLLLLLFTLLLFTWDDGQTWDSDQDSSLVSRQRSLSRLRSGTCSPEEGVSKKERGREEGEKEGGHTWNTGRVKCLVSW